MCSIFNAIVWMFYLFYMKRSTLFYNIHLFYFLFTNFIFKSVKNERIKNKKNMKYLHHSKFLNRQCFEHQKVAQNRFCHLPKERKQNYIFYFLSANYEGKLGKFYFREKHQIQIENIKSMIDLFLLCVNHDKDKWFLNVHRELVPWHFIQVIAKF